MLKAWIFTQGTSSKVALYNKTLVIERLGMDLNLEICIHSSKNHACVSGHGLFYKIDGSYIFKKDK